MERTQADEAAAATSERSMLRDNIHQIHTAADFLANRR